MDIATWAAQKQQDQRGNFQDIINMFVALKKWQQEQDQQERMFGYRKQQDTLGNQFEERRTRAYEKNTEPNPVRPPAVPAEIQIAQMIASQKGVPVAQILEELKMGKKPPVKTPEDIYVEEEARAKARAKWRVPATATTPKEPDTIKPQKGKLDYIKKTLSGLEQKRKELERMLAGGKGDPEIITPQLQTLDDQITKHNQDIATISEGGILSEEDWAKTKIMGEGKAGWLQNMKLPIAPTPVTPKRPMVKVGGKEYPLEQDGTVIINGKKYRIG